ANRADTYTFFACKRVIIHIRLKEINSSVIRSRFNPEYDLAHNYIEWPPTIKGVDGLPRR
ncbi:unnamed protein product, partial [Brassica oleracea var. botrytis]